VRASIPKKSKIRKAEHAKAAEPQKFSSNFHPYMPPATQKMWVKALRIVYPNRRRLGATYVGNVWSAIRTSAESGARHPADSDECCSQSTVPRNAPAAFPSLHSKVTNTVLHLASAGAAFVFCESRLIAALCGSGEVEAWLAGKAPQSWFGALSLPPFARSRMTAPDRAVFEQTALSRRRRKSSAGRISAGRISIRCDIGTPAHRVCRN
jgi:hypothetical protein